MRVQRSYLRLLWIALVIAWQLAFHWSVASGAPGTRFVRAVYHYRADTRKPIWWAFDVMLPTAAIGGIVLWAFRARTLWLAWLVAIALGGIVVALFLAYAHLAPPPGPRGWPATSSEEQLSFLVRRFMEVILAMSLLVLGGGYAIARELEA